MSSGRRVAAVFAAILLMAVTACADSSSEPGQQTVGPTARPAPAPTSAPVPVPPTPAPAPVAAPTPAATVVNTEPTAMPAPVATPLPTRVPPAPTQPPASAQPAATSTPTAVPPAATALPPTATLPITVAIPVPAENAVGLLTLHFKLSFDPAVMTPTSVDLAPGLSDALLESDLGEPGSLTVGVIEPNGYSGSGNLVNIEFTVMRPDLSSVLAVSDIEAYGGDTFIDIPSAPTDGRYGPTIGQFSAPVIAFGG